MREPRRTFLALDLLSRISPLAASSIPPVLSGLPLDYAHVVYLNVL